MKQIAILGLCVITVFTPTLRGDDHNAAPNTSESISLGLAFLFQQQNYDGSFGPRDRRAGNTGLVLMAFLATGNTDDGGRYAANIRRALDFLTRESTVPGGDTEDQAIFALALCRAYGVEPDEALRQRIEATAGNSLKSLLAEQRLSKPGADDGGWSARSGDAKPDPIASCWAAMALGDAARIGLTVPKVNLDHALAYIEQLPRQTAAPTTQQVNWPDDRSYFDALRIFTAEPAKVQAIIDDLIHRQQSDGSWKSGPTSDADGDLRATSRAILVIGFPLGVAPRLP